MKKKLLYGGVALIILLLGFASYYIYTMYHPIINICVANGPNFRSDEINIERVHISYAESSFCKTASSILLKLCLISDQDEYFVYYIERNYQTADIDLEIIQNKEQTFTLHYTGTATTYEGETVEIDSELDLKFRIDATIKNS